MTVDPRIKYRLREGDCFVKDAIFASFSSVTMNFFSAIRLT